MKKFVITSLLLLSVSALVFFNSADSEQKKTDHADLVSGPFATPQDVTKACIECHEESANDFMKTRHWNWEGKEVDVPGKGKMKFGKKVSINNFCVAVSSNEPRCTSCHPGYGWKDKSFDFTKKENIDCLICHDQTGTYSKVPTDAGMPDPKVDLVKVAQSVGKPTKNNCGQCHFNGGGGTAVKHGDLDPTLLTASKELDVHMGGLKFECIDCHKSTKHEIHGASNGSLISNSNHISCTNCHSQEKIHKNNTINKHMSAVACETCHIPEFSRGMATKVNWDWSTAGQREDEKYPDGSEKYKKMKGDFTWGKNVVPTYAWHDGGADFYLQGDKIDPTKIVELNKLRGNISSSKAKITPFKLMKGKQIYDKVNNYLIIPKLFGKDGFWKTYDWNSASEIGMKSVGLPYSGQYGFVETQMWWAVNHMVTPKTEALKCNDCHNKGTRMDWQALGYDGDPMKKGGREKAGKIKN